jgi:hypothetical protein
MKPVDTSLDEGQAILADSAVPQAVSLPDQPAANPCLSCGACCAFFRCSFYWREADDTTPGGVPVALTQDLGPHRRVMRGTDQRNPHCVALAGEIGTAAGCSIYDRRPSTCRIFVPAWYNGEPNIDCDRARVAHGLAPLTPDAWEGNPCPEDTPHPPTKPGQRAA